MKFRCGFMRVCFYMGWASIGMAYAYKGEASLFMHKMTALFFLLSASPAIWNHWGRMMFEDME